MVGGTHDRLERSDDRRRFGDRRRQRGDERRTCLDARWGESSQDHSSLDGRRTRNPVNENSWEEAVRWFRAQPDHARAVCDNYFDLPVQKAAERYARGEEFAEVLRLLGTGNGRSILDLGAGNGIASFALARNGWRVTAVEPDPSEEVGAGAIRSLARDAGLDLSLVQCNGERLLFSDDAFDAVYARQVFHHAASLEAMAC